MIFFLVFGSRLPQRVLGKGSRWRIPDCPIYYWPDFFATVYWYRNDHWSPVCVVAACPNSRHHAMLYYVCILCVLCMGGLFSKIRVPHWRYIAASVAQHDAGGWPLIAACNSFKLLHRKTQEMAGLIKPMSTTKPFPQAHWLLLHGPGTFPQSDHGLQGAIQGYSTGCNPRLFPCSLAGETQPLQYTK